MVVPVGLLLSWAGALGFVALGISAENPVLDVVATVGAVMTLLAPFIVASLLAPGKARHRRGGWQWQRPFRHPRLLPAIGVTACLGLAAVAFIEEEYEAMAALGFVALFVAWLSVIRSRSPWM
jgi:hypothetical protein